MFDSHCHLTDERLQEQLQDVLARAANAGITRMLTIGTDLEDDAAAIAVCQGRENLRCAIGIHPNYSHEAKIEDVEKLKQMQLDPAVMALGEMGLDYHYEYSSKIHQREIFEAQVQLAQELNKPVIIHCREAVEDTLAVLRQFPSVPAVFHCFTGSPGDAEKILGQGYLLGFTGVITFKKNDELREVVRNTPMDRMLLETDALYLSPEPVRKQKTNEPALIVHTLNVTAQLKLISPEQMDETVSANARRLFRWDP